jgi:hypothetical protein
VRKMAKQFGVDPSAADRPQTLPNIDMRRLPPKYDPTGVSTQRSAEQTNDPLIADHRNFYKVEKWMSDGSWLITCCMPAATSTRRGRSLPRRSAIGRVSG